MILILYGDKNDYSIPETTRAASRTNREAQNNKYTTSSASTYRNRSPSRMIIGYFLYKQILVAFPKPREPPLEPTVKQQIADRS